MNGLPFFERTRFLPQIDEMVRQDRRGAIDDMLQALRELGVVKVVNVAIAANGELCRSKNDDGYKAHVTREAAVRIGIFLDRENAIVHSFDPEGMALHHETVNLHSAAEIVVRPK